MEKNRNDLESAITAADDTGMVAEQQLIVEEETLPEDEPAEEP
jgi:hypothetical protein